MRSMHVLSTFFILSAIAGMLLIGYSYISISDETIAMFAGSASIGVSFLFWFAALWKTGKIAAKNRQVSLNPLNIFQMIYRLPYLLDHISAGQKAKGIDPSLSYAVIVQFFLLPVSMVLLPFTSTTVLLALLLGMYRLSRQWKKAVKALELPTESRPASARATTSRSSYRLPFETLGTVTLHILIAFLLAAAFSTFYLVPFEGYRHKVQKISLEEQLSNAYGAASSYLQKHPDGKVTTIGQLAEGGWHETGRIRFVRSDLSEKGGTIILKYAYSPRSRHEPEMGKIISDGKTARMEILP